MLLFPVSVCTSLTLYQSLLLARYIQWYTLYEVGLDSVRLIANRCFTR